MKKIFYFIVGCFIASTSLKAQVKTNYMFTSDSLSGFSEQGFIDLAKSKHLIGEEYKYFLYHAKREFVNHKYSLTHDHHRTTGGGSGLSLATVTVQPSCTNIDFETGTLAGWAVSSGNNLNSLTMAGCCPTAPTGLSTIITGAGTDPIAPAISLVSPFGGTKILKMNNSTLGTQAQRVLQTFNVSSSNAVFQIAYAGVLNSGGHNCDEQPYINISVYDSSGNVLPCPKIDIQAPSTSCTAPASVTAGWNPISSGSDVYYHTWDTRTLDLSPYIGQYITIQLTVANCIYSGHYGYGYFDCRCLPLEVELNGTLFDATPSIPIDISTCGALSAYLNATTGLGPYTWNGPAGSGISGVTTQSIITTTAGIYTLTMSPPGACYTTVKYIYLHISPNPTVTNITSQATCTNATGSSTILAVGGTTPYTYSWTPSASTSSLGTGLSPGTDYTVEVIDNFGCRATTSLSILSFTNGPTYTVTPTTSILNCITTSVTISALTGTNSTAVWTHTPTSSFIATSAGSYSVVLTNTVSMCTTTVPVTVTSNTTPPSATYSSTCSSGTITLNAFAGAGIALGWLAPTLPAPTPLGNPGTSAVAGIFTLTATNLSTGCKTTYTVESLVPIVNVSVVPQNTITCAVTSITATASYTPSSASISWLNGSTTSTVNPNLISNSGTYTVIVGVPGGCSTQSVISITTNTNANVNITSPSTIIPCSTNSLTLNASSTGGGIYTYAWSSPAATGSAYSVSNAGTYSVMALNTTNGCTATATQAVSHETVTASFDADPYSGLMPLSVSFTNTSVNPLPTSYSWNLGNSSTTYTTNNPSTVYNTQGTYTVVLTATKGFCVDTAVRLIYVELVSFLTVPNVFTPNGDGKNDTFYLDCINMGEINMTVFDRWGLKMFEGNDNGKMIWDGKTKGGNYVTDGTYFYIINAKGLDTKDYNLKGTINVFK